MKKVPIGIFIIWAICLVGIVIGFGKSEDAFTIAGYHIWKAIGWICTGGFLAGIIWYFVKGTSGNE